MTTTTLYVFRRVRMPAGAAAAAFDELVADATPQPRPQFVAPAAVLQVRPPHDVPCRGPADAVRAAEGRLSPRSGRLPLAVEVELVPWSRRETSIGIRPRGRMVPLADGRRQRRFVRLADAMALHLAWRLEDHAATWEREVLREAAALVRQAVGI
jgi:hypothetical protein